MCFYRLIFNAEGLYFNIKLLQIMILYIYYIYIYIIYFTQLFIIIPSRLYILPLTYTGLYIYHPEFISTRT